MAWKRSYAKRRTTAAKRTYKAKRPMARKRSYSSRPQTVRIELVTTAAGSVARPLAAAAPSYKRRVF